MFKFKKLAKIILVIGLLSSINVFAHEDHNKTPGMLKANHGGKVEAGKEINLEYVVAGTEVKLFAADHDGKDLALTEVELKATAKLPKGKPTPVTLTKKDGAYVAQVDFKSAYRVEMNVDAIVQGKKSTFKIQIEK